MKAAIAQINTAALRHNLAVVKRHAPQCKIIAVVKANAYGHGLLLVARTWWMRMPTRWPVSKRR